MKKIIATLLIKTIFIQATLACSCDTISLTKAIQISEEIFYGRVVKIEEIDQDPATIIDGDTYTSTNTWCTTFEIVKKWKGNSSKFIKVFQEGNSCDYFFDFGGSYIVYAQSNRIFDFKGEKSDTLWTWQCARNNDFGDGWDDTERLDALFPKKIKLLLINNYFEKYFIGFIGIGVMLFLGFYFWKNRKNGQPGIN